MKSSMNLSQLVAGSFFFNFSFEASWHIPRVFFKLSVDVLLQFVVFGNSK